MAFSSFFSSLHAAFIYVRGLFSCRKVERRPPSDRAGVWVVTVRDGEDRRALHTETIDYSLFDLARYLIDTTPEQMEDEAAGYAFYAVSQAAQITSIRPTDEITVFSVESEMRVAGFDHYVFLPDIEDSKIVGVKALDVSGNFPVL